MTEHKRIKKANRLKDYQKKRNIIRNAKGTKYLGLMAGDGVLPRSKKYLTKKSNGKNRTK